MTWALSTSRWTNAHIDGCVGHGILWDSDRCRTTPSKCISLPKKSYVEIATTLETPSNGRLYDISEADNVHANYGFSRTFRRTAEGRARAANLDTGIQNAMNRWKKIEQAKGKCPRFNMVDHYSHARDLMHVTWRYSLFNRRKATAWPSYQGRITITRTISLTWRLGVLNQPGGVLIPRCCQNRKASQTRQVKN